MIMSAMGLAEIHVHMAKCESLLTHLAAVDKLRGHEISQALPRLKEARMWLEGALEKEEAIAKHRLSETLPAVLPARQWPASRL
jgi:hypothetical protein